MDMAEWTRDLAFYLIAGVTLIIFGMVGKINLAMALMFLSLYLFYIIVVLVVRVSFSCLAT